MQQEAKLPYRGLTTSQRPVTKHTPSYRLKRVQEMWGIPKEKSNLKTEHSSLIQRTVPWDTGSCLSGQEIYRILWNPQSSSTSSQQPTNLSLTWSKQMKSTFAITFI